jgi:hypothetical protein
MPRPGGRGARGRHVSSAHERSGGGTVVIARPDPDRHRAEPAGMAPMGHVRLRRLEHLPDHPPDLLGLERLDHPRPVDLREKGLGVRTQDIPRQEDDP